MKIYSKANPIDKDLRFSPEPFAILLDKDIDISSFFVVKKLKYILSIKKVGHAGTLDPFATGLLILCFNKGTKSISQFQDLYKVYDTVVTLGKEMDSGDITGKVTKESDYIPKSDELKVIEEQFLGEIEQVPPAFSALKKNGKRFYELARKGIDAVPDPRNVTIHQYSDIRYTYPEISFSVKVSKGTYIRSLGRDIGKALNSCGYVSSLRRSAIGEYLAKDAYTYQEIADIMEQYDSSE